MTQALKCELKEDGCEEENSMQGQCLEKFQEFEAGFAPLGPMLVSGLNRRRMRLLHKCEFTGTSPLMLRYEASFPGFVQLQS